MQLSRDSENVGIGSIDSQSLSETVKWESRKINFSIRDRNSSGLKHFLQSLLISVHSLRFSLNLHTFPAFTLIFSSINNRCHNGLCYKDHEQIPSSILLAISIRVDYKRWNAKPPVMFPIQSIHFKFFFFIFWQIPNFSISSGIRIASLNLIMQIIIQFKCPHQSPARPHWTASSHLLILVIYC